MKDKKEIFIAKAQKRHGNKYDYSKVEYVNSETKVTIICPIHGEFEQTPTAHVRGHNCPKCSNENRGRFKRLTKEEFVKKAKRIHGDEYDYSKVECINANTKLCIICPTHPIVKILMAL